MSKQIFFIYVSKYLLPVVETFLVDPGPLAEVPEVDLLYPVLLGPFEGLVGRERGQRSWLRCVHSTAARGHTAVLLLDHTRRPHSRRPTSHRRSETRQTNVKLSYPEYIMSDSSTLEYYSKYVLLSSTSTY